jgi:hypothetical protein
LSSDEVWKPDHTSYTEAPQVFEKFMCQFVSVVAWIWRLALGAFVLLAALRMIVWVTFGSAKFFWEK